MSIVIANATSEVTVSYVNDKTSETTKTLHFPKEEFTVVKRTYKNEVVFVRDIYKTKLTRLNVFPYAEITAPSHSSISDLVSQINVWRTDQVAQVTQDFVFNEAAATAEMDGVNKVFTTDFPFVDESAEVFFNQLKLTMTVDYTEDGAAGEITMVSITPDATLETPDTLTFNYLKS